MDDLFGSPSPPPPASSADGLQLHPQQQNTQQQQQQVSSTSCEDSQEHRPDILDTSENDELLQFIDEIMDKEVYFPISVWNLSNLSSAN